MVETGKEEVPSKGVEKTSKQKVEEYLKEHMNPGEVFISNIPTHVREKRHYKDRMKTLEERLIESGKYSSVRRISPTFNNRGEVMPNAAAIVVKPRTE